MKAYRHLFRVEGMSFKMRISALMTVRLSRRSRKASKSMFLGSWESLRKNSHKFFLKKRKVVLRRRKIVKTLVNNKKETQVEFQSMITQVI